MSDHDRLLVSRAQGGDREAFAELVERYSKPIYGLVLRMVRGRREEAEDLTQEVFLRAYKALPRFRGESKFSTWLRKIAVNRTLNSLQKKSLPSFSLHQSHDGEEHEVEIPDASRGPDRMSERQETAEAIERAVGELSEALRLVFVMREFQGLSHEEIAQVLGSTSQAVRVRHHRAKKELAQKLEPYLRAQEAV